MSARKHINRDPSVLTLCFCINDTNKWDNVTYRMDDCLYNDYSIHLINLEVTEP